MSDWARNLDTYNAGQGDAGQDRIDEADQGDDELYEETEVERERDAEEDWPF